MVVQITPLTKIQDVVERYPGIQAVFRAHGLPCASCHVAAYETIAAGVALHQLNLGLLIEDLTAFVQTGIVPEMRIKPRAKRPLSGGKLSAPSIQHVIAVMSGKGGVGKSLVTGLLATALRRGGLRTGILDADITGPSIPKMFGVSGKAELRERRFLPQLSSTGIAIMSISLLMDNERDAVIWRGPMVTGAIQQFFCEVEWGDLDYLFVDLPPGTSDAPLTVLQRLPVEGVVIVSTPQQLAVSVVTKALKLAQRLQTPVLGIVENMAYVLNPVDGSRLEVFGPSQGPALVAESGAPLLARLPLDPSLTARVDRGEIEQYHSPDLSELEQHLLEQLKAVGSEVGVSLEV
ncbi:MAG: P-loop NTPase [Chloroflexi bacterium]|nr:P-loop NTPase [Chloroflexota bacterium]